ncbi:MAG: 30S ribosomal protein S8 [Bacteroidetes bacterium]|nr:MAG: 30S ribosomal protein S8 [Bacteroidota bacterium]
MPVTDTIADFITQIRNAGNAKHKTVDIPCSNTKLGIAAILKDQGYISDFEKIEEGNRSYIRITLRYYQRVPAFNEMKRVSKPGRRVYAPADKLPRVKNGLGVAIISTSKGIMSDKQARQLNIGGELLCTIW